MKKLLTILTALLIVSSCNVPSLQANEKPQTEPAPHHQEGIASWYSIRTNGGTETASGYRLSNHASTAAHRTLPFGTRVRVINLKNNKSEIVKITDRGPFKNGRVIDVTVGVAERLGFKDNGLVKVRLEILK